MGVPSMVPSKDVLLSTRSTRGIFSGSWLRSETDLPDHQNGKSDMTMGAKPGYIHSLNLKRAIDAHKEKLYWLEKYGSYAKLVRVDPDYAWMLDDIDRERLGLDQGTTKINAPVDLAPERGPGGRTVGDRVS